MKLRSALIGCLLLPAMAAPAQDIEIQAELMNGIGTGTSRKGDLISARVVAPAALQGDMLDGKVNDSKAGGKIGGRSVLSFSFETLRHGGQAIPLSAKVQSIANSKGQMNTDEEGRVVRGSSGNVGKVAGGTGAGALIGGLARGGRGAAIGAVAGAVASIVLIEVAAEGPSIRLDAGSRVSLLAKSRSGPSLASLSPNAAPAAASQPAPVVASVAAPSQPAAPAAAPAAAQPAAGEAPASQQPNLTAVKADFIPGEKTIFFDDFTDMAGDEPPPHWKVRGGTAELRVGQGVRQLALKGRSVTLTPNLTALPVNFTMETEVTYSVHGNVTAWTFFDKKGKEVMFFRAARNYTNLAVHYKVGPESIIDQNYPVKFDQPVKQALWCQNGRLRLYINGQRLFDVNQITVPEMGTPRVVIDVYNDVAKEYVGLGMMRFAESTPDFSQMISSSGRYVTHGILFDTDSDRLKPESAAVIRSIARGLETNPALKLLIEGHTDSTGSADRNLDLSKRRAEAVKAVLVSQFSVDAGRLTTAGLGATKPMDSNDTPTGRAQNRRVEFAKQ
jgi:outer membrane protein OmpA-like peptidoglycan-associated protein